MNIEQPFPVMEEHSFHIFIQSPIKFLLIVLFDTKNMIHNGAKLIVISFNFFSMVKLYLCYNVLCVLSVLIKFCC